jgi:hypothetical protein
MLDVFPSALNKPSGLAGIPNRFTRPAFEKLYGFDASDGPAPGPGTGTLLAEPGLYSDIILTTPLDHTIRYATDIQAILVRVAPDWLVYYSVHNYNFLVTDWETHTTTTWDNMT